MDVAIGPTYNQLLLTYTLCGYVPASSALSCLGHLPPLNRTCSFHYLCCRSSSSAPSSYIECIHTSATWYSWLAFNVMFSTPKSLLISSRVYVSLFVTPLTRPNILLMLFQEPSPSFLSSTYRGLFNITE